MIINKASEEEEEQRFLELFSFHDINNKTQLPSPKNNKWMHLYNDCNKAMVISCTGYTIEHTPFVKLSSELFRPISNTDLNGLLNVNHLQAINSKEESKKCVCNLQIYFEIWFQATYSSYCGIWRTVQNTNIHVGVLYKLPRFISSSSNIVNNSMPSHFSAPSC